MDIFKIEPVGETRVQLIDKNCIYYPPFDEVLRTFELKDESGNPLKYWLTDKYHYSILFWYTMRKEKFLEKYL